MSNSNDILADYLQKTNSELTINKSHKKDKEHKHKHSKDKKEKSSDAAPVISDALTFVTRGGTNASSSIKPQLEGTYHLTNILQYLQDLLQNGKPPVSEEEINKHFHIKIRDFKDLLKKLKNHPHVDYEGKLFRFRPTIDIADKNQLLDQLTKLRAVKTSELQGAYKGFEKDLKQLVDDKIIDCFNSNEDRRVKLYYHYDQDLLKLQAPEEFLTLWAEIEIPESNTDRETLLRQYQAKPFQVVEQYPSLDPDEGPYVKTRKKRVSTKSTNAHLFDELNAPD